MTKCISSSSQQTTTSLSWSWKTSTINSHMPDASERWVKATDSTGWWLGETLQSVLQGTAQYAASYASHHTRQWWPICPSERMQQYSPPFTVKGVDLFGPFNLKITRNKSAKALGALFTCATVPAFHLEKSTISSSLRSVERHLHSNYYPTAQSRK